MKQYLNILNRILTEGTQKTDRTGTGTLSIFGTQSRYNLQEGFPLLTTKKLHLKSIIYELLWFLRGDTNVHWLQEHGVRIWNEWADEQGELGPVYGHQWRSWPDYNGGTIDQIENVVDQLKNHPDSRRYIPGRSVQHCLLCPAPTDDGTGYQPAAGRVYSHHWRHTPLPEPPRTGTPTADTGAKTTAGDEAQPRRALALRLPLRRLPARRLQSLAPHQGRGECVNKTQLKKKEYD